MKRVWLMCIVFIVACGLLLAGCGSQQSSESNKTSESDKTSTSSTASKEVITIKMTGHMPVGQHCTVASQKFQELVEEKSNGTIKFEYYPAGQLAMDKKALEMCMAGGIQMAEFFTNRAIGIIPEVALFEIPLFASPDQFARLMLDRESGGGIFYDILVPKFREKGLHLMPGFMYSPEHSTITKKPIHKMEDYKGLKIRVSGHALGLAVESWGAVPTVMSSSDVYTAIQRGTVDGANSGLTSFVSRKWYEVADHVQALGELQSVLDVIVNLEFWNSLTPEQQKIIRESLRTASIWSWEEAIRVADENLEFLKSKGLQVVDFAKEHPDELEKIKKATFAKMSEEIKHVVGDELWAKYIKALEATKEGDRTWKQVLQTAE